MFKILYVVAALLFGLLARGYCSSGWTFSFLLPLTVVVGVVSAVILGAAVTIALYIKLSPPHKVTIAIPKKIIALHTVLSMIDCSTPANNQSKKTVVISRKIDAALNEMIDRFVDTRILVWYSDLVHDPAPTVGILRDVLWHSIISLHERLTKIDQVKFVMCGIITSLAHHLERIRLAEAAGEARGERGVFHLSPQLSSPVRERNFLRLVSEFLVIKILPPEYHRCTALRNIIKEFFACKVLEPLIDRICNPDWINEQLVQYLHQQQAAEELGKRTYHYAKSYEDFINLIHDSSDVHELKHFRRNIINEIMQATAINNLKKAKGLDTNRDTTPQSTGKGDLLQARNLKRYINQLTYAKAQCERRIAYIQKRSTSKSTVSNSDCEEAILASLCALEEEPMSPIKGMPLTSHSLQNLPGRKILMFQVLLDSAFARRYFAMYLDEIGQGALLSFWSAVQELRHADKRQHYQLGMEIYHTYLASHLPPIKIDKVYIRGVEAFLLGNRGPEVLFEISEEVERTLEDRHYTGFLVSATYHAMLTQAQNQGIDFMSSAEDESLGEKGSAENGVSEMPEALSVQLSVHSTYARNKLAHLQERLTNKLLALQAIQQTNKADPKVITHLENEITNLRNDHRQLEAHVERTWLWSDHLGHWRVYVETVQVLQEKEAPQLVLFVHLDSDMLKITRNGDAGVSDGTSSADVPLLPFTGWVVVRKLSQLTELHRKLCQIDAGIKCLELPTIQTKLLFNKQLDSAHLVKMRTTSQNYFNAIMTDEKLSGSELIFAFLSPSPEHLKQIIGPVKKSKFSFSSLFKSIEGKVDSEEEEMGNLIVMEGGNDHSVADSETVKDSIVEPLFAFLEELCELRGLGKWLRKTLISFVQITYGKNITRHVRETVQGLLSESMVIYYLETIRTSVWPDEELVNPPLSTERTLVDAEMTLADTERTRSEAQELFVRNLPELLSTLVGQQNAKKGAARLFCTLQHHALNKNLFYTILETLLKELFVELQNNFLRKY